MAVIIQIGRRPWRHWQVLLLRANDVRKLGHLERGVGHAFVDLAQLGFQRADVHDQREGREAHGRLEVALGASQGFPEDGRISQSVFQEQPANFFPVRGPSSRFRRSSTRFS